MLTPGGKWAFSGDVGLQRKVVGVEAGIGLKCNESQISIFKIPSLYMLKVYQYFINLLIDHSVFVWKSEFFSSSD